MRRAHPPIPPAPPAASAPARDATSTPATEPDPVPAYDLDRVSRKVPISGRARCAPVDLVRYAGSVIPFQRPLRIHEAFRDHVRAFESLVRDTAIEVYGRPPTRIHHMGSFYCRRISTYPFLVSEHGLGNAMDIGGFDFARLRAGEYPDAPARHRGRYKVRLSRHWNASGKHAVHSRFLRRLARKVIDADGLFRVILGPGHPNHQDHFHLDMARMHVVDVF